MYFTITPVAERFSIAWTYVARDYGGMSDEQTRQFEDMITLQAELHLRSDRTAIAYRKWLRQLGLTFGTA